jgi:hypothetical protein
MSATLPIDKISTLPEHPANHINHTNQPSEDK